MANNFDILRAARTEGAPTAQGSAEPTSDTVPSALRQEAKRAPDMQRAKALLRKEGFSESDIALYQKVFEKTTGGLSLLNLEEEKLYERVKEVFDRHERGEGAQKTVTIEGKKFKRSEFDAAVASVLTTKGITNVKERGKYAAQAGNIWNGYSPNVVSRGLSTLTHDGPVRKHNLLKKWLTEYVQEQQDSKKEQEESLSEGGTYKDVVFKRVSEKGDYEFTLPEEYFVPGEKKDVNGRFVHTVGNIQNDAAARRYIDAQIANGAWPHRSAEEAKGKKDDGEEGGGKKEAEEPEAAAAGKKVEEVMYTAVEAGTAASIDEFVAAQESLNAKQKEMLKIQMERLSKDPKNEEARSEIKKAFGADFLIVVLDFIRDAQNEALTRSIEKLAAQIEQLISDNADYKARIEALEKGVPSEGGTQSAGGVNVTLSNIGNIAGAGASSGGQGAVPQAVPAGMQVPQAAQSGAFAQPQAPAAPVQAQASSVVPPVVGESPLVQPAAENETTRAVEEHTEGKAEDPTEQEATAMLQEATVNIPLSIQSVLERKRGDMPTWKRVRNALGLMVLGGAAGATVLATAGVPAALASALAGSQLATFSAILTGAGSGLAAGGIAGAVRGVSDVLEAKKYAKSEGLTLGLNVGKVVSYLKGKTLRGGVYGAIGGGIAGGVMDTYGDDIRAATEGARDWFLSLFPGDAPITETPPPAACPADIARGAAYDLFTAPVEPVIIEDLPPIDTGATPVSVGGAPDDVVASPVEPVIREDLEPVAAEPAPVEEVPEVPAASAVDPALVNAFTQPATNGGVWTAAEHVTEAAGVAPGAGGGDLLTYLTDLAEDYTQDGSVDGTRATSYYRDYGEGLLNTMTSQAEVTQATIRNPINMAHLYANENIYNDMLRRIADNSGLSGSEQEFARETVEKLHEAAQVALER